MQRTIKTSAGKKYTFSDKDQVGQGSYATVYKGFEAKSKQVVAIKVVGETFAKKRKTTKYHEIAKREVEILQKIEGYDNVLQILDFTEDEEYAYIITEFCEGGSLRNIVKNSKIEESKAVKYLYDIAKGLSTLHQKGIMHRDINLQNILLLKNKCIVSDFGSAVHQRTSDKAAGTPTYQAPELFRVQPGFEYTNRIDIWSMGVVFFKMLFGRKIYKEFQAMIEDDQDGIRRFPQNPKISHEALQLLDNMLTANPKKRISAQEVVKDQLFKKYNFSKEDEDETNFPPKNSKQEDIDVSQEDEPDDEQEEEDEEEEEEIIQVKKQPKNQKTTHPKPPAKTQNKKKGKGKNKKKNKHISKTNEENNQVVPISKNNLSKYFLGIFIFLTILGLYFSFYMKK